MRTLSRDSVLDGSGIDLGMRQRPEVEGGVAMGMGEVLYVASGGRRAQGRGVEHAVADRGEGEGRQRDCKLACQYA